MIKIPDFDSFCWKHSPEGEGLKICRTFLTAAREVMMDQDEKIHLALICFLAQGHLLIEDIPGVGKTTFAQVMNQLLGLSMGRIQFTQDLLPADILGNLIYRPQSELFEFRPGALFSQFVLADELNRANPKTQSALLQCMEERQVSLDRETYSLPSPFFMVATQNPRHQVGTYPLPESQLDRFLMRIQLGYPNAEAEVELLLNRRALRSFKSLLPLFKPEDFPMIFEKVGAIHVSFEIAQWIQKILTQSRKSNPKIIGLSPRAGLALIEASKAAAYLAGRTFVMPEDVKQVAAAVINHRISSGDQNVDHSIALANELVNSVESP